MMTTCRLLCGLLVLALCCCPSVCMTASDVNQVPEPVAEPSPNVTSETGSTGLASGKAADPPGNLDPKIPKSTTEQGQGRSGISGSLDPEAVTEQSSGTVPVPPGGPVRQSPGPNAEQGRGGSGGSGGSGSSGTAADTAQTKGERNTVGSRSPGAGEHAPELSANNAEQLHGTPGLQQAASEAISDGQQSITASSTSESEPQTPNGADQVQEPAPSVATGADEANDVADPLKEPDTTTTTNEPTTTTTTTTTTGAPSRLRENDGSLSSSAWVCAPLLLAVSALAYTTLG
ncbi:mucin TcMUCII, putative [Trypanosoma cruzi marinkellei]|uniref:Mucin TcMUCII, putative n=1 Tax=Trypanosoma cruzi marinkellei TaxID=85056 RepID=K2MQ53_TRYCR|nr:mucin TcMUCII, putative [Trypanosoma cruzi marinkellei]